MEMHATGWGAGWLDHGWLRVAHMGRSVKKAAMRCAMRCDACRRLRCDAMEARPFLRKCRQAKADPPIGAFSADQIGPETTGAGQSPFLPPVGKKMPRRGWIVAFQCPWLACLHALVFVLFGTRDWTPTEGRGPAWCRSGWLAEGEGRRSKAPDKDRQCSMRGVSGGVSWGTGSSQCSGIIDYRGGHHRQICWLPAHSTKKVPTCLGQMTRADRRQGQTW